MGKTGNTEQLTQEPLVVKYGCGFGGGRPAVWVRCQAGALELSGTAMGQRIENVAISDL
jgi:hypothetical protein